MTAASIAGICRVSGSPRAMMAALLFMMSHELVVRAGSDWGTCERIAAGDESSIYSYTFTFSPSHEKAFLLLCAPRETAANWVTVLTRRLCGFILDR